VPLRFAPTGSKVAFTSNWRVQNSSQLVNNVVLDAIEALDTAPKHTDRFQKNYFASTICSTTPKKFKIGDTIIATAMQTPTLMQNPFW